MLEKQQMKKTGVTVPFLHSLSAAQSELEEQWKPIAVAKILLTRSNLLLLFPNANAESTSASQIKD